MFHQALQSSIKPVLNERVNFSFSFFGNKNVIEQYKDKFILLSHHKHFFFGESHYGFNNGILIFDNRQEALDFMPDMAKLLTQNYQTYSANLNPAVVDILDTDNFEDVFTKNYAVNQSPQISNMVMSAKKYLSILEHNLNISTYINTEKKEEIYILPTLKEQHTEDEFVFQKNLSHIFSKHMKTLSSSNTENTYYPIKLTSINQPLSPYAKFLSNSLGMTNMKNFGLNDFPSYLPEFDNLFSNIHKNNIYLFKFILENYADKNIDLKHSSSIKLKELNHLFFVPAFTQEIKDIEDVFKALDIANISQKNREKFFDNIFFQKLKNNTQSKFISNYLNILNNLFKDNPEHKLFNYYEQNLPNFLFDFFEDLLNQIKPEKIKSKVKSKPNTIINSSFVFDMIDCVISQSSENVRNELLKLHEGKNLYPEFPLLIEKYRMGTLPLDEIINDKDIFIIDYKLESFSNQILLNKLDKIFPTASGSIYAIMAINKSICESLEFTKSEEYKYFDKEKDIKMLAVTFFFYKNPIEFSNLKYYNMIVNVLEQASKENFYSEKDLSSFCYRKSQEILLREKLLLSKKENITISNKSKI